MSEKYSVKAHLQAHHGKLLEMCKAEQEFHAGKAKDHHALADAHGENTDAGKIHKKSAKRHEDMTAMYGEHVEHHTDMLKAIETMTATSKAMHDNRLVPDAIHGIVPDYPGVRAIPRFGQRELEKVAVDPSLDFIVQEIED